MPKTFLSCSTSLYSFQKGCRHRSLEGSREGWAGQTYNAQHCLHLIIIIGPTAACIMYAQYQDEGRRNRCTIQCAASRWPPCQMGRTKVGGGLSGRVRERGGEWEDVAPEFCRVSTLILAVIVLNSPARLPLRPVSGRSSPRTAKQAFRH